MRTSQQLLILSAIAGIICYVMTMLIFFMQYDQSYKDIATFHGIIAVGLLLCGGVFQWAESHMEAEKARMREEQA